MDTPQKNIRFVASHRRPASTRPLLVMFTFICVMIAVSLGGTIIWQSGVIK